MKFKIVLYILVVLTNVPGFSVAKATEIDISAPGIKVERSGKHIYYRTSWSQLSQDDQHAIIDKSVQLFKNELTDDVSSVPGLKKFSNAMLSDQALNALTAEAQKSVDYADTPSLRGLLPSALLLYGGIDGGVGLGVNGGISGDLGEVIFPEKVIDVDTETGAIRAYIKIDHAAVVVPHAHLGLGAGGGLSYSVGVALVFGNMTSASDMHGVMVSGSGDVKFALGADVQVSVVHNLSTSQNFFLVSGEVDFGPEATANIDGEGGYVYSLDEIGTIFGKKLQTGGTVVIPVTDKK